MWIQILQDFLWIAAELTPLFIGISFFISPLRLIRAQSLKLPGKSGLRGSPK